MQLNPVQAVEITMTEVDAENLLTELGSLGDGLYDSRPIMQRLYEALIRWRDE